MVKAVWVLALIIVSCRCLAVQADQRDTRFEVAAGAESIAEITASAPSASWDKPGAEGTVATVYVDGEYNQDIALVQGAFPMTYRIFLGPLRPGSHLLRVVRNDRWSAAAADFKLDAVRVQSVGSSSPEYRVIAHAPILYARADTLGRFTDAPLLMWYERFPRPDGEVIQYSIIYTNEDGGTETDALMARWGRTTDIEYVYRVTFDSAGNIRDELFQAPEHRDLHFQGRKLGQHPYFLDATLNNVFLDGGYSPVQYRFVPVAADLTEHSREEVMDRFPWTYKASAQEMQREGKLRGPNSDKTAIADPRQYLYVELNADNRHHGASAVWVKLRNDSRWRSSHHGRLDLTVFRSGWFRTTVELPAGTRAENIETIAFECVDLRDPRVPNPGPPPDSVLHPGGKAFLLDADYRPGANILGPHEEVVVQPGEMLSLTVVRPQ